MPVRLEPAAPRSRVKHSTTEPLRSLSGGVRNLIDACIRDYFLVENDICFYNNPFLKFSNTVVCSYKALFMLNSTEHEIPTAPKN